MPITDDSEAPERSRPEVEPSKIDPLGAQADYKTEDANDIEVPFDPVKDPIEAFAGSLNGVSDERAIEFGETIAAQISKIDIPLKALEARILELRRELQGLGARRDVYAGMLVEVSKKTGQPFITGEFETKFNKGAKSKKWDYATLYGALSPAQRETFFALKPEPISAGAIEDAWKRGLLSDLAAAARTEVPASPRWVFVTKKTEDKKNEG